jgi:multiple antibiotic resistance protein
MAETGTNRAWHWSCSYVHGTDSVAHSAHRAGWEQTMSEWLAVFVAVAVPLFVAIDPIAITPFFLDATDGLTPERRKRVLAYALTTAAVVGFSFLFLGEPLLTLIGLTVPDFAVAGGIVLLVISIADLMMADKGVRRTGIATDAEAATVGAVPLGMPLIVGPATTTTLILLHGRHGWVPVFAAFCVCLALTALAFAQSTRIVRILGPAGARAFGKVSSLVLAALGVRMIRVGLEAICG